MLGAAVPSSLGNLGRSGCTGVVAVLTCARWRCRVSATVNARYLGGTSQVGGGRVSPAAGRGRAGLAVPQAGVPLAVRSHRPGAPGPAGGQCATAAAAGPRFSDLPS